jgi:glutaredoxin-related protein
VDNQAQGFIEKLIGQYGWLFIAGVATLIFQNTIREAVDGLMVFLGNDYNEDDVVEVDGEPGRIVRVSMWKTVFFIYHIVDGKILGGSKLVVTNSKLKDLKIEKPLANLDLSKYSKK